MKLRLGKRIAVVCLSFVMLVAACFTEGVSDEVPVQAATEKEVTLGAGVLAAHRNSANAAKVWYGYSDTNTNKDKYVWRVVGYDRFGVAGTDGKMTLLADGSILVDTDYDDTDPVSNYYGGSTLESNVNAIAGELSGTELSAVSVRTLTGGSANEGESGYNSDHISGNTVPDAVMWPLSAAEAYSLFESLRRLDGSSGVAESYFWWLRTPGASAERAAYMTHMGDIMPFGTFVYLSHYGVRPAFHLDLSSVIFSSLLSGTAGNADAEYKLTVQDDQMNMELGAGGITWNGRTATVPYRISGVRAGSANRISAVITDGSWTGRGWSDEAAVKYYSKLNTGALPAPDANGEVTGTVSFTLPDDYVPSWDIYFLAENAHDLSNDSEKKCTDYASAPVAITRTVTLGTGVLEAGCNTANAAKVWYGYDNTGTDPDIDKNKYVWSVVGYNGNSDGVAAEAGKMTLLANENIIYDICYNNTDPYNNYYGGSNLQSKVNAIAGELSGPERSAVSKRTLIGDSANAGETGHDPDHISGNTVENAVMWPLSAAEADILPESLRRLDGGSGLNWGVYCWWLRSPGDAANYPAYVYSNGNVYAHGYDVDYAGFGVRPAFHLDLSSVIFSSLISGTAGTPDAEYKLTLKQDGSSMQIAANVYDALLYGNTVEVSYNITGSRSANRVSVMITDKAYTAADARILQYGKLNVYGTFGSTGTGTFTIDNSKVSGIWGTDFHVYILAEEVHLENEIRKTDYASAPVELTGTYVMGEHIHGFTYTQSTDGHSIDAVCTANGCTTTPVPNASLTISAPALTSYGGTEIPEATLSGIADFNAATGLNISSADILYRGRNNTSYADTAAPTDPGEYTASITVNGITASVDYSIAQIPITITAASGTWVYDGTAHSNTTVELTAGDLVTGDALVAEASGSVTNVSDTADGNNPVAAGYKIMRGTVDVTAEYNITTVPGKLTITSLSVSGAAVTLNSSQLQYNESEQTVGISSVVVNGTTLTEGVDYTVSGNKATNIGNYTVTITGTNNCTGSVTAAWSIIEPANNTPVYVPSTPDPEPTLVSDGDTRTYNNPDGSVTTKTTNRHDNGSVTVEEKTEFEDGSYTLVSETKDKDGNLISRTDETKTISKKGTAVVTTKTVNANGSTLEMVVKTTKKGYSETSTVASQVTKKGNTLVTVSMTDSDGYELSMGFTVKKGVVTLTSFETSEGLITIPDEITVNGVTIPVAAILKGTFKNNTTIINATIGRNVTVIGSKAFYGAKNLKRILVYGDLEKVGKGAFKGIAKDALIKIKADKENYNRIVELIKASGIGKNVKFKRVK